MAPEFAIAPTGNGWISEMVPGFDAMRASYRWSALGIFAMWLLIIIFISTLEKHVQKKWLILLSLVLIFNLPNLDKKLSSATYNRTMFQQIDQELIPELRQRIKPNETVVFLPWGNDFFANYLAPKAGFRTFNVGGDKNLEIARSFWPAQILSLGSEIVGNEVIPFASFLIDGTADVIVLPYFDMLGAIHFWPCSQGRKMERSCLPERRAQIEPLLRDLRLLTYVEVVDTDLFATIKLRPEYSSQAMRSALMSNLLGGLSYPFEVNSESAQNVSLLLYSGWHQLEDSHVWSRGQANLRLVSPEECADTKCEVRVRFFVHGASAMRPVDIYFKSASIGWEWSNQITATSGEIYDLNIPLSTQIFPQIISITIPSATSPVEMTGWADARELGIALIGLELIEP
jgi:hypothetical protein